MNWTLRDPPPNIIPGYARALHTLAGLLIGLGIMATHEVYRDREIVQVVVRPTVKWLNEDALQTFGYDICRSHGGFTGQAWPGKTDDLYWFRCTWANVEHRVVLLPVLSDPLGELARKRKSK